MNKRSLLILLFTLVVIYPIFSLFQLGQVMEPGSGMDEAETYLKNYQISIWLSWVVMAGIAVYYKWSTKNNLFFLLTYGFLIVAFSLLGFYTQQMVNLYDLPSRFEDNYTFGVFAAIQNILSAVILTGFLQAGVWWFTRRWHRR